MLPVPGSQEASEAALHADWHDCQGKSGCTSSLRAPQHSASRRLQQEGLTWPKSLGFSAPPGAPLKFIGKPPPIGPPKGCALSAELVGGGACEVSTGRITRCTVLPSVTSAQQQER